MYATRFSVTLLLVVGALPLLAVNVTASAPATNAALALEQNGGLVTGSMGGPELVVVDQQDVVPGDVIQGMFSRIQSLTRLPIAVKKLAANTGAPSETIQRELSAGTNRVIAVVVVCVVKGQPSLLVAPDDHWAVINVDALTAGTVKAERETVQTERLRKESWRAIAMVVGGTGSMMPKCVLGGTVGGVKGLDMLGRAPGLDALPRIVENAKRLGVQTLKIGTYRAAVSEGWAPAPTNDTQRAIWKEAGKK